MTSIPYCILLLVYLHHQVQSASRIPETAIGVTPDEEAAIGVTPDEEAAIGVTPDEGAAIGVTPDEEAAIGVTPDEEDNRNAAIIDKLSETMDLVSEVNSRLKDTQVYLEELRKELSKNLDSTEAALAQLEKQHIESGEEIEKNEQIQVALSEIKEYLSKAGDSRQQSLVPVADGGSSVLQPRDCSDIRAMGSTTTGVYPIYAGDDREGIPSDVYCDFDSLNESWLVFQRRMDGSEKFERNYLQYENGFGNLSGEFWLGNQLLHLLTTNRKYKLRIDLEDFNGEKRYAEYSTFVVNSSADFYRLTVDGFIGNAGDGMSRQNNMRFSARDIDNDIKPDVHCAGLYRGGWWYSNCHTSNLNGLYLNGNHPKSFADGIEWSTWHGYQYSLKKTEMKLMPLEDNVDPASPIIEGESNAV